MHKISLSVIQVCAIVANHELYCIAAIIHVIRIYVCIHNTALSGFHITEECSALRENVAIIVKHLDIYGEGIPCLIRCIRNGKQRFTRGYKRYKETSGLIEWKECQIFHSIFT